MIDPIGEDEPTGGNELTGGDLGRIDLPAKPSRRRKARALYSPINVLRTESEDDFANMLAEATLQIAPKDFIERQYVRDVVCHTWDTMRYRRIATGVLNNAIPMAVEQILYKIQFPPSTTIPRSIKKWLRSRNLAYEWMFQPEVRRRVSCMLREFGYDESAIEAKAYRMVAEDLEGANRMARSAEAERDKAVRRIAKYRKSFADQLWRNSESALAAGEMPRLIN